MSRYSVIKQENRIDDPYHFTISVKYWQAIRMEKGSDDEIAAQYSIPLAICQIIRSQMPRRNEVSDAIDDNP